MSDDTRMDEPFAVPPAFELFADTKWPEVSPGTRAMIERLCTEYEALQVAADLLPYLGARWVQGMHWPPAWVQLVSAKNRAVVGPPEDLELDWSPPWAVLWVSHAALGRVVDLTVGNMYGLLYHALRSLQEEDGALVVGKPELQRYLGEDVDMADWMIKAVQLERQLALPAPLEGVTEDDGAELAPSGDDDAAAAVAAATALLDADEALCAGGCGTILSSRRGDYEPGEAHPTCADCLEARNGEPDDE